MSEVLLHHSHGSQHLEVDTEVGRASGFAEVDDCHLFVQIKLVGQTSHQLIPTGVPRSLKTAFPPRTAIGP